jgi:Tol biopolymer transport system component
VFLVSITDGSTRRLTTFGKGQVHESPRFSLDGARIVFTVVDSVDRSHVMQLALGGGQPQPLRLEGLREATVQDILPGGLGLLIAGRSETGGQFALFRTAIDGGVASELPFGRGAPGIWWLDRGRTASAAQQTPTLAYVEDVSNVNVWRVAAWPGSERKPERWIASTRDELSPAVSPDGAHIAIGSNRSATSQLWLVNASGENPKALTSLSGVMVGSPRWSPDGTQIAFDARVSGNPDVWVVPRDGGEPRQLTMDGSLDAVPAWSRDGNWIYFSSDRTGRMEVWRIPSMGGTATQITREGGFNPHVSPDRTSVYYLKGRSEGELRRCPAAGGKEEIIAAEFKSRNFVVLQDGTYGLDTGVSSTPGAPATHPGRARFYRFRTRKWEDLGFATDKPVFPAGIALSPDRKWLFYSQIDDRGSDIMLVQNFR